MERGAQNEHIATTLPGLLPDARGLRERGAAVVAARLAGNRKGAQVGRGLHSALAVDLQACVQATIEVSSRPLDVQQVAALYAATEKLKKDMAEAVQDAADDLLYGRATGDGLKGLRRVLKAYRSSLQDIAKQSPARSWSAWARSGALACMVGTVMLVITFLSTLSRYVAILYRADKGELTVWKKWLEKALWTFLPVRLVPDDTQKRWVVGSIVRAVTLGMYEIPPPSRWYGSTYVTNGETKVWIHDRLRDIDRSGKNPYAIMREILTGMRVNAAFGAGKLLARLPALASAAWRPQMLFGQTAVRVFLAFLATIGAGALVLPLAVPGLAQTAAVAKLAMGSKVLKITVAHAFPLLLTGRLGEWVQARLKLLPGNRTYRGLAARGMAHNLNLARAVANARHRHRPRVDYSINSNSNSNNANRKTR